MRSDLQRPDSGEMEPRTKDAVAQEGTRPGPVFRPEVDIVEGPAEYVVTADLPGVGPEDLRLELEEGVLSIDAEPSVRPEAGWTLLAGEYRQGRYHRQFTVGEHVDADGIQASVRNGVVEIHLPKTAQQQPRRISISHG